MRCVMVSPDAVQGNRIRVRDPAVVHHVRHVLRVKPGDSLACVDGAGQRYIGRVLESVHGELVVGISEPPSVEAVPAMRIVLAQALIKPQRLEWVVEKCTELGVDRLIPVVTARSMVRLSPDTAGNRLARWRRIAAEAAEQCGRARALSIEPLQRWEDFLPSVQRHAPALIPTLAVQGKPLHEVLARLRLPGTPLVLIGPEGDFTPGEVAAAERHGAVPVSLGPRTLRSETAAIATLAILQHAAGVL